MFLYVFAKSESENIESDELEDLRLLGEVGYRVANGKGFPEWKAGSEFRAKRLAMEGGSPETGVRSK